MLKKITLASLLVACLITVGCTNKVPDSFTSFSDTQLGLNFSYPPEWGEVKIERPATNLVSISFDNEEARPPLITLLQKVDAGNSTGFFTSFNESAKTDCEVLKAENQQIVQTYKAQTDADQDLLTVIAKNPFECEALNLNKQAQFLASRNILQVDEEEVPKLVPLVEYRFVFGKELAYQSGVAIKPKASPADLETVLKSINVTKIGTFESEKRARPETSSYLQHDHELISFNYPKDWEVKMEGTDVLLVAPQGTANGSEPVPVKIKIWPNSNNVNVDQFKQVVTPVLEDLNGQNWQVFKNFPGVYALDLRFLPYQNQMIEVTTLASTDANYDPKTEKILNTLKLK